MEKPKIIINVRNMPNVAERPKKVSRELDKIESGEYAEIIADDERIAQTRATDDEKYWKRQTS